MSWNDQPAPCGQGRAECNCEGALIEVQPQRLHEASCLQCERFLLHLVAVVLIAEVLLFTLASAAYIALAQRRLLSDQRFWHRADSSLEPAFGVALNTRLALLGGKAASDSLR